MFFIDVLKFLLYKFVLKQDLNWILVFKYWERRYKNNYAVIIDKISYGITSRGTKVALIEKELSDLLETAQGNPTKENYSRLKKWIIKNLPASNKRQHHSSLKDESKTILSQKNDVKLKPLFNIEAKVPPTLQNEFFKRISFLGKTWKQDHVHISRILINLPKGAALGVKTPEGIVYEPNIDIYFTRKITDKEFYEICRVAKDLKLPVLTQTPDKVGINLYNISQGKYGQKADEFLGKIEKLRNWLRTKGIYYNSKTSIRELRIYGNPDYGATKTYEQATGEITKVSKKKT